MIHPIQIGGSFLISLASPLVSLASRVVSKTKRPEQWTIPAAPPKPGVKDEKPQTPDQSGQPH